MNVSPRLLLPIAGAVVLMGAVLGVALWPAPALPPDAPEPVAPVAPPTPGATPTVRTPAPAPRVPAPPSVPTPAAPTAAVPPPPNATVVPIRPGDVVPEPESAHPLPQVNDAIEPEQPQTAQWKLEKTKRITLLLSRDVERLTRERDAAAQKGDERERQRLDTLIRRHQDRLRLLKDEAAKHSAAADLEPPTQ
ncbi:hypothetical protein [Hyalangium rubrum]|uniref:Uncharacterized protein n=1 Tax=Hyalangium rubrum TaxID=3103134 RepID=A0ABU5H9Y1_9BACT|nr:hypothetical protein [Hyalangium sp. s54d21]MDY7230130.1 hypothetical protein [Hyalangium sp. s54d21]